MYAKDGDSYYIVDGHTHFWDGSPANQINRYGEGFIKCFYDYHANLSPDEYKWTLEEFERYPEEDLIHDLFEDGYDDMAILQSTYLTDWYVNGFNTTEQNGAMAERHPGRFIVNGRFDPRDGEAGPGDAGATARALAAQGRQGLHRGVEGRLQGLEAQRPVGVPLSGEVRGSSGSATSTCTRDRPSTR